MELLRRRDGQQLSPAMAREELVKVDGDQKGDETKKEETQKKEAS